MPSSPVCLTPQQRQHCKTILNFWHKLEFFIPFDLEGQILDHRDADWSVRSLSADQLATRAPGQDAALWQVARVPTGLQLSGFELYLGVFDKSLLGTVTHAAIAAILDAELPEAERYEQTERADLEGKTCYAKIRLTAQGTPLLNQISVSTVPWALGQVADGQLAALDMHRFDASLKTLQDDLHNFIQARQAAAPAEPAGGSPGVKELPLTHAEMYILLELLYAWAGFAPPTGKAAVVIRARAGKPRKETPARHEAGAQMQMALSSEDEDDDEITGPEIDILNSFYAKDLQLIARAVDSGDIGPAMLAYLTPLLDSQKTDLYSAAGRERLLRDLHPAMRPPSQWLGEPAHAMSLMQQFAINNIFSRLAEPGIFSVNGPPGTGKTTLLRDIFAENITRRALVLAGFENAADALDTDNKLAVEFHDGTKVGNLVRLRPEVCGFEMLVASSNNAAIENISRDLPKAKSIGTQPRDSEGNPGATAWRHVDGAPKIAYLQQVAHRIAAQNSKGDYVELASDETPWGLISAVLGNRGNRRLFADRLRYPAQGMGKPPRGYDPSKHQSLWQWRDGYRGLNFARAKKALLTAQHAVTARQAGLVEMSALLARLGPHTSSTWTAAESAAVAAARGALRTAQDAASQHQTEREATLSALADLDAIHASLEQDRPAWWKRWFRRAASAAFERQLADNRQAQRLARERKITLEQSRPAIELHLQQVAMTLTECERVLADKLADWAALQTTLAGYAATYPEARRPRVADELEAPQWQRDGLWHDAELNKLRSALFAAALALQQAWLADVLQDKVFSANMFALCGLLSGQRINDPDMAKIVWQSLFMVVPVVSSTFASIADQFRGLGAGALGWLFIDEAGQAVPQAAPGAIWRCQRVVVVGDPMQIEPVFTVPIRLIDALAATTPLPDIPCKPHQASVQTLADAANETGVWIDNAGGAMQWIGSPLRVHRRCVEPMFSIANAIAYDNKMVYGLSRTTPPRNSLDLGPSAWVDLGGRTSYRQTIPEQVTLVLRALLALYKINETLPPLYVISPFKAIKDALIETLGDAERWRMLAPELRLPGKTVLRTWCRTHVGTVHTFQGKEEQLVWMVLGCDADSAGAANWAARKPNLLNVALTRAQHRVFLIGDATLWGGKKFFQTAMQELPVITAEEFERRCKLAGA